MENKVIDLSEYRLKKQKNHQVRRYVNHNTCKTDWDQEERKKTLSLFMKVLATMRKESY